MTAGSGGAGNAPFFVDNEVIELAADGTWIADGIEISHEPTRNLFARSLRHDDEGYFLSIGRETKRIHVVDTAYFIQRIDGDCLHGFDVLVNDRVTERLRPETLQFSPGRLVCFIERAGRKEAAKFLRHSYMDLMQNLQHDSQGYFLEIGGVRVGLGC